MDLKLPFGFRNNRLVHIDDVERGKKCDCVCPNPSCRAQLIAAKGEKNQHHFRHASDCECKGGLESAIHIAAKQVLTERKTITLPKHVITILAKDSKGKEHSETETFVKEGTLMYFDSVQEEKVLHGMKADILAKNGDSHLIIEVFYRHKVDDKKREKIAKSKMSAIEINLSDLTPEDVKDMETFSLCVISEPRRIQWLHNAEMYQKLKKLEIKLATKIREQEKLYEQDKVKNANSKVTPIRLTRQRVVNSNSRMSPSRLNKGKYRF